MVTAIRGREIREFMVHRIRLLSRSRRKSRATLQITFKSYYPVFQNSRRPLYSTCPLFSTLSFSARYVTLRIHVQWSSREVLDKNTYKFQLWTVYLEEVSKHNLTSSETHNVTMSILLDFWGKVTPCVLQLVSHSKVVSSG